MSTDLSVEKAHANYASTSAGERRRAALTDIDEAKFSWFHAKACIVAGECWSSSGVDFTARFADSAGVGFFTDAYDIFSISIAATMIGYVYHSGGSNTANQDLGIKVAHSVGTFVGQLLFGWLADRVGRKRMYGIELVSWSCQPRHTGPR
jgi:PHS family inorganic phosphate transporter-like MFS transporter